MNQSKTRHTLTLREQTLVSLLADGLRNKEIAERLAISENTVETRLKTLYRKLGIHTRLEAALWFVQEKQKRGKDHGKP